MSPVIDNSGSSFIMCDYNSSLMGATSPYYNSPLQTSSPVSNQLDIQNQCIGNISPINDPSYGNHGVLTTATRNNSQYPSACLDDISQSGYFLSNAVNTLNNYEIDDCNNSFDIYDNLSSMIAVEPKPEPRQSNSPYGGDSTYESLYLRCTPTGTPMPDNSDSLLPDEPALQSLQSLQDLTLDSSFTCNDLQSHPNSLYPNFDESLVQSQSSMSRQATHLSVNSFNSQPMWQGDNSYDNSSNVWTSPQHNSSNYSNVTSDSSYDHLLNEDPLNIPCEQLLPHLKNCNIQQLINNAELSGSNSVPEISSPSPSIVTDPRLWTKDDIRTWLTWARKEFNLTGNITVDLLPPTGAELCSMSKQQLQQRVGDSDGEKLARYLDCILNNRGASLPEDLPFVDPYEKYSSSCLRLSCPGSGQIQLWQFLLELLSDRSNESIITWENSNSEFKILDPDEVARRWGDRKTKPNMNYDKLSRALRYYYDRGLMTKVAGKRYAYKVNFPSLEQLHASQQGSEPKPSPDFALISALSGAPSPTPTWCSSDTPSPRPPYC